MKFKYYRPTAVTVMSFPFSYGKGIIFENIRHSPLNSINSSIIESISLNYMLKFNEEFYYGLNKRSDFIVMRSEFLENY